MEKKRLDKKSNLFSNIKKFELELEQAEDKTAFTLLSYSIKKRHVFAFATLMFIFALSLRTYQKFLEQNREPGILTVLIMFIASLIIIVLLVIRKHNQWRVEHNFKNIAKRTFTLYLAVCVFLILFSLLSFLIQGQFFYLKEFIFMLSISIVFGTITLDTM